MKKAFAVAGVAGLAVTSAAFAVPVDKNYSRVYDTPLPLADAGAAPGVTTSTILVTDNGIIDTFDYAFIDIDHTWVGDLVVSITDPSGNNVIRLLNRPGFTGTGFGYSGDLAGQYRFQDGAAAFPSSGGAVVPVGIYAPFDAFAGFHGKQKEGIWTLTITDNAGGDTGVLRAWGFGVTNVPTPGAFALLGLGGLAAARRRRA